MLSDFAVFGLSPVLSLIVIVVLAAVFAFEVWMFISAITNKNISDTAKVLWVVGMVLIHPIVAIIYFFTDYRKTV